MNDLIDDIPSDEDSAFRAIAPPLLIGESTTSAGRRYRAILDTDGRAVYLIESWRNAQSEMEFRQALELSEPEARAMATGYEGALQATLAKPAFLSRLSHELRTP